MKTLAAIFFLLMTSCITGNGQKVGIGTNTPRMALHVSAPDSGVLIVDNKQALNEGVKTGIFFTANGYYTGAIQTIGQGGGSYARMGFLTYANGTPNTLKERLSILDNDLVGIGTTAPTNALDINGTLRIRGGSPGAGKLLTSDANGVASWQTPAAPLVVAFRTAGLIDNLAVDLPFNTWVKVIFQQLPQYNYGLGYQGIAGEFQAPVKGLYHFDARVDLKTQTTDFVMRLMRKRNGSSAEVAFSREHAVTAETDYKYVAQFSNLGVSVDLLVQAGDIYWVEAASTTFGSLGPTSTGNWFSGHLIQQL